MLRIRDRVQTRKQKKNNNRDGLTRVNVYKTLSVKFSITLAESDISF